MSSLGYIYMLLCPLSKQVRYIGQTINPKQRLLQHIYLNNNNGHFHHLNWLRKLKKLKLKPEMEIIHKGNTVNLNFWEQHYISLYKSWGFDLTNTSGKEYFRVHKKNHTCGKKVFVYTKDNFIGEFKNAREVERTLQISYKLISGACNGNKIVVRGYVFSFVELSKNDISNKFNKTLIKKEIVGTHLINNTLITFISQLEAARQLNINFRNINQCLKGIRKSCAGYTWKYIN